MTVTPVIWSVSKEIIHSLYFGMLWRALQTSLNQSAESRVQCARTGRAESTGAEAWQAAHRHELVSSAEAGTGAVSILAGSFGR